MSTESLFPKHGNSPPPVAGNGSPRVETTSEAVPDGQNAPAASQTPNPPLPGAGVALRTDGGGWWRAEAGRDGEPDWKAEAERLREERRLGTDNALAEFDRLAAEVEYWQNAARSLEWEGRAEGLRDAAREVRHFFQSSFDATPELRLNAELLAKSLEERAAEAEAKAVPVSILHEAARRGRILANVPEGYGVRVFHAGSVFATNPNITPVSVPAEGASSPPGGSAATFTVHEVAQDGAAKGEGAKCAACGWKFAEMGPLGRSTQDPERCVDCVVFLRKPPAASETPSEGAARPMPTPEEQTQRDEIGARIDRIATAKTHPPCALPGCSEPGCDAEEQAKAKEVQRAEMLDRQIDTLHSPGRETIIRLMRLLRTVAHDSRFCDLDCCDEIQAACEQMGVA